MKRIRNYFILTVTALCCMMMLAACGDDDDDFVPTAGNLAGFWESVHTKGWEKIDGVIEESWDEPETDTRIRFSSQGTFEIFDYEDGEWDNIGMGTWTLQGSNLMMNYGYMNATTKILTLDANMLVTELHEKKTNKDGSVEEYYSVDTYRKISDSTN